VRFLVDESTGPSVARWLKQLGHDVFSVYDQARGLDDQIILRRAVAEDRVLITNHKDFGELIFRENRPHRGVVLLRLEDERAARKIEVRKRLLGQYADRLANSFVVVTEASVRISRQ
jgi:predicted nuclease of predicted toxin-antitoxin system